MLDDLISGLELDREGYLTITLTRDIDGLGVKEARLSSSVKAILNPQGTLVALRFDSKTGVDTCINLSSQVSSKFVNYPWQCGAVWPCYAVLFTICFDAENGTCMTVYKM